MIKWVLVVMDENEILDVENYDSQENNWDNKSVEENQIKIDRQLMDLEEGQQITLVRSNSFTSLLKDFSSLTPEMQKIVWNNCVSNFDFEQFKDRLALVKISTEGLPSELEKLKLKIINSILGQNGYFIDKKNLENIPVDDNFLCRVIDSCIDCSIQSNSFHDQGDKITTLITELSKWMKGKKLAIYIINRFLLCCCKDTYQCLDSKNLELDKPILSLDNLKKIILCIDFNQNENIDWYCNEIYRFFNLVCDLLIRMKQDNQYIKVYIANLLSYFGYKTEGIENVEDQPEFLSKLPAAEEFYENAKKSKAGLELLRCIKSLGFTLILDKNETFKLEKVDEIDKLIASIGYCNDTELNNWVKGVNTINEENRNQNADDENAKDNYLEIKSFDDFKNMKKKSIVSFIEKSKNESKLKEKYKILLEEDNQDRLNEVVLDMGAVDYMLQIIQNNIFCGDDVNELIRVLECFYQYTDKPSYKASPWTTINLLMAFKQGSLKTKQMLKLLEINNWNAPLDPDDLNHNLNEVWSILSVLGNEEKIPEELLNLIDQTFDFTKVSLDNDDQLQFFYRIVAHLIKHSEDYKPGDLESISFFLDNIVNKSSDHNNGSDGCTKFLDGCTKFLIEIIGKIPSCKLYLQPLISPKDDEKNLIKMFNQSSFAKDKLEIDNQQEISIEGNTKSEKKPDKANNNATEIVRVEQFTAPASIKNEETKNEGYKIENNINFRYELKKNPEKEIVVINDSEMNKLKIENSELKEENKALKEENKTLKNKEKEQLDNLTQMQNKNEKLLPNIDENQKTMEVLNNRIKELEMQNKKLTSEIKQLTEDKEKANNLINESPNVNNQIERLQNEKNNLSNQNNQLLNELEQLKAKISEYKNNQVQEISNVNPKTQSKPNKKLKYTLYIFALIIAVASVAIGFYMSLYAFLGLIVSLILLFVVSCLNSKSQEENNFKLINNNITSMTDRNLLNKYKDINKTSNITQLDLNPNKLKENKGKDGN